MSFIIFLAVTILFILVAAKNGILLNEITDTFWICLAILSAGEAIGLRVWKNK